MRWWVLVAMLVACGHEKNSPTPTPTPTLTPAPQKDVDAGVSQEETLAAIQKAMNELAPVSQQCWAKAATERFDIEGELEAQIEIADTATVAFVRDTTRNEHLAACMRAVLAKYSWAPPLHGQTIRLPFKFAAPDGQSVIDRKLVDSHGQGGISVAVLLDENNSGNGNASMFELALAPGKSTGMRWADRAELWYFLAPAAVKSVAGGTRAVAAGDMMYAPKGCAREVAAKDVEMRAMIVVVPGGREGAARAGALPNRVADSWTSAPTGPIVLPAADAKTYGPATIFSDALKDKPLAASVLALPAVAKVPEHGHDKETEMLYVLEGAGTMTVAGTDVAVTPTSVIQIPPNTKHAFAASAAVRAVQIYTPAGPEQRFKKK